MPEPRPNLRVPGPTPVPDNVARAGARPMINHRGPEFAAMMEEVLENLKPFFGSQTEPLLLTGSGTGAQEAAIVNVLSPGDEVLAVTVGVFGDRFADIAEAFGARVHRLEEAWGAPAQPEAVAGALGERPDTRAVLLTHNETSTGVTNDLPAIVAAIDRVCAGRRPLLIVDGISSIGALPFAFDRWGIDVALTGSQKAWMSPPGLAMVAVSERAWEAHRTARMPRFYWDFTKAQKSGAKRTTPFTPAVGVVAALHEALRTMTEEGPEAVFARHRRVGGLVRAGLRELGLELFARAEAASDTVTAVRVPDGVDGGRLLRDLRQRGVVLGSGQDRLKGRIFRIGHMGHVGDSDVAGVLDALGSVLREAELARAG